MIDFMRRKSPDLSMLRMAGLFASPEGEGAGGDKGGDEKDGKPTGEKPEGEKGADGGDDSNKNETVSRITTLVDERNTARQEAAARQAEIDRMKKEIEQLKASDQSKVVSDLQKQLTDAQEATKSRFDKLLEIELANLPDAAAKAVQAIPGGSEVQFDWLTSNRSLFSKEEGKPEDKKGIDGPKNDKKPDGGDKAGPSSAAKAYTERQKPKEKGFAGLV